MWEPAESATLGRCSRGPGNGLIRRASSWSRRRDRLRGRRRVQWLADGFHGRLRPRAVDRAEEVPVDPVPQEDAEYQLPAEASAEETGVVRNVDRRHIPGGANDRQDRTVEQRLEQVA